MWLGCRLVIIRCTAKVLKLLGGRPVADIEPGDDDWYLNLLWFGRRKCLLLVHASTLFPVFTADVRTSYLRPLAGWVSGRGLDELRAEHLPAEFWGRWMPATPWSRRRRAAAYSAS